MYIELHYPTLSRQPENSYRLRTGEFYAASNYQSNYDKVAEDCKHRCVYCDATEKECGGERFSLDHFRPRSLFANKFNGILVYHPFNLHLACQKCNVLKSKDWQGCLVELDGPTYTNGKGYIDRFKSDLSNFLEVDNDGRVRAKVPTTNDSGPGEYMIRRLHLNRPSRTYIRKKRCINMLVKAIEKLLFDCTYDVTSKWENGLISAEEGMNRIKEIQVLREKFLSLKV